VLTSAAEFSLLVRTLTPDMVMTAWITLVIYAFVRPR
jgi:hypothetical protein